MWTAARLPKPGNGTRECRGIECRLPARMRAKHRGRACAGEECVAEAELRVASSPRPPAHLADRAAQFLGDFPDLEYPPPELGAAPLGVQLTCDIKPGENEVPSEDALILHLQLAKGQETLVEALRAQQVVLRDLQQKLAEQQGALLSQQSAILEQHRGMYEQMDAVQAQCGLLSDAFKQASFRDLQGELQSYFQSHLAGLQNQARGHPQRPDTSDRAGAAPEATDAIGEAHFPQPLLGLRRPLWPGGVLQRGEGAAAVRQVHRVSAGLLPDLTVLRHGRQDVPGQGRVSRAPEDLRRAGEMPQHSGYVRHIPARLGEGGRKFAAIFGGFRCLGVSEREAPTGFCGRDYFYNRELQECQACSDCDGEPVSAPCTPTGDAVCAAPSETRLSRAWATHVAVPPARTSGAHIFPGLQMDIQGAGPRDLLSVEAGRLAFRQHGLVWLDQNFAVRHSCRNFLQVGLRLDGSQEDEGRDLSGVRIEQPDGKFFQGASVSACVEVEPDQAVALVLRSPNQHCNQSTDLQVPDVAAPSFSLLWLSHDTGAVAMTAQMTLLTALPDQLPPDVPHHRRVGPVHGRAHPRQPRRALHRERRGPVRAPTGAVRHGPRLRARGLLPQRLRRPQRYRPGGGPGLQGGRPLQGHVHHPLRNRRRVGRGRAQLRNHVAGPVQRPVLRGQHRHQHAEPDLDPRGSVLLPDRYRVQDLDCRSERSGINRCCSSRRARTPRRSTWPGPGSQTARRILYSGKRGQRTWP
ncbi:hypothetical protein fugu_016136 [Takifugu bimaculatus]|uniref:TNFR-Cys domain-containing protein n=1 Tax=Takifugu bimaculatus TaxID=433685 RepID=A0A4Z2BW75_9TELE|nr:hypothetical protein fugu_016136 [Takifugu bimaculatus]